MQRQFQNDIALSMQLQIQDLNKKISQLSLTNSKLKSQSSINQKVFPCQQGHPMRYLYTKITVNSSRIYCDICQKGVDKQSNVFWNCRKCDYDVCSKCGGFHKQRCPFNHKLQYIQKYYKNTMRCDICHKGKLQSGWNCDCDFDICDQCYNH